MSPGARGVILSAPASGSGKTVVTLGLLRHLAKAGVKVASAKVGPDYIDPAFHAAASGEPCFNLDPWAMRPATLAAVRGHLAAADLAVCEGVMGLFDGAVGGAGSTADLAQLTGWPVVLIVDVRGQAASVAALLQGFVRHRPEVRVAGCIFNRVGSAAHVHILTEAVRAALPEIAILGAIPRDDRLALPERHLGLVQAGEHAGLDGFLDAAALAVGRELDVAAFSALADTWPDETQPDKLALPALPVLGQRIAVASDAAFAFCYPLTLIGWRAAGAEIRPFSPLAGEGPDTDADAVYLPGGYPELHAGRLAAGAGFLSGLKDAAARGVSIFGECGGYMVLGRGLVDGDGDRHEMAGLLPLETSFANRRLHLGYRRAVLGIDGPLGSKGMAFRGHEFHYATILSEGPGEALFETSDAAGRRLGAAGLRSGTVAGSFVHLIDREANG